MVARASTRRRGRTALIAVGVVAVVLAGAAALVLYLAPHVLPNLNTTVAEGDTAVSLDAADASATVTVPDGWVYHRGWGDDAQLVLRSPDAALSVTLTVTPDATDAAFAAAVGGERGAPATERLASGLDVVHADEDGGALIAAVGPASGGPSVQVRAQAPTEEFAQYRAAIAAVLEGLRVGA